MIAVYNPEESIAANFGVINPDDLCACGQLSEFGTHWVSDNEVCNAYYCEKCMNKKRREG